MAIQNSDDRVLEFCTNFNDVQAADPDTFGLTALP